jgi:hypothetical protein
MNTTSYALPLLLAISLGAGILISGEESATPKQIPDAALQDASCKDSGCLLCGPGREYGRPDLLKIEVVSRTAGQIEFDVALKPGAAGTLSLTLPNGVQTLEGKKPASDALSIPAGAAPRIDRYRYVIGASSPEKLLIEARLLDPAGKVHISMSQAIQIRENTNLASEPVSRRVPVVLTTPDGTKRVEYMTEAQAAKRNLTPATPQAPASK